MGNWKAGNLIFLDACILVGPGPHNTQFTPLQ